MGCKNCRGISLPNLEAELSADVPVDGIHGVTEELIMMKSMGHSDKLGEKTQERKQRVCIDHIILKKKMIGLVGKRHVR